MKQKSNTKLIILGIVALVLTMGAAMAAGGYFAVLQNKNEKSAKKLDSDDDKRNTANDTEDKDSDTKEDTDTGGIGTDVNTKGEGEGTISNGKGKNSGGNETIKLANVSSQRKAFLKGYDSLLKEQVKSTKALVKEYRVEPGLINITNTDLYSFTEEQNALLEKNGFFVNQSDTDFEFFSCYEENKYWKQPNFITVDSMMHTYHLYFMHLLKNTEKKFLASQLLSLSENMQNASEAQLNALSGSEWEEAAKRNLAFFSLGRMLLDPAAPVPGIVEDKVRAEYDLISEHSQASTSPITGTNLDYTQFIVRGYYEGDEVLEQYFRAMMWYGQVGFLEDEEDLVRSALLISCALDGNPQAFSDWEAIYTVTNFFAGASDDNGYYEYKPIALEAYGNDNTGVEDLKGNAKGFENFLELLKSTPSPKINSLSQSDTGVGEALKTFRFMGQRFSIDATIFQNLIYDAVGSNSGGDTRLLPNALDIPAAFGSDEALSILKEKGETDYEGYSENMEKIREELSSAPDSLWTASLSSLWLRTLKPLAEDKGEGYPSFMRSSAWKRKNLQTFLGSYTELKHDTVLYAKQSIPEGDSDAPMDRDDHGYVEPEPELFYRLSILTKSTYDGLNSFGMLDKTDGDNLLILEELCKRLYTIADKELKNETPSEEEYELIQTYGDQIQHLWMASYADESDYPMVEEFPAPLVTDVANDGMGSTLELATGKAAVIYVIVPVDGSLRIASGTVYQFYQFVQPSSERLTDTKWRQMMGFELTDDGKYNWEYPPHNPEDWTEMFSFKWQY